MGFVARSTNSPTSGIDINWEHPISRGLISCILPTSYCDLVTRNHVVTEIFNFGAKGKCWSRSSSEGADVSLFPALVKKNGNEFTAFSFIQKTGTWSAFGRLWSMKSNGLNSEVWECEDTGGGTGSSFTFRINGYSGNKSDLTLTNFLPDSNLHSIAVGCQFASSSTGTQTAWKDGALFATGNLNTQNLGLALDGTTYNFMLGNTATNQYYLGYHWMRFLKDTEIKQLHTDPYCFLLPKRRRRAASVSANNFRTKLSILNSTKLNVVSNRLNVIGNE